MKKIFALILCAIMLSGMSTVCVNAAMSEDNHNLSLTQAFKLDDTYKVGGADMDMDGRVKLLWVSCEFMGLSAAYQRLYVNGDSTSKKLYEERCTELHSWLIENNTKIYIGDAYKVPTELDLSEDPATQFFNGVTSRKGR